MPKSKRPARAKRKTTKARAKAPDLPEIMWQFSQAISLVIVCHRSLSTQEDGDELEALGQAIEMLHRAHNELDMAITRLSNSSAS
jgi:hypothetical protein